MGGRNRKITRNLQAPSPAYVVTETCLKVEVSINSQKWLLTSTRPWHMHTLIREHIHAWVREGKVGHGEYTGIMETPAYNQPEVRYSWNTWTDKNLSEQIRTFQPSSIELFLISQQPWDQKIGEIGKKEVGSSKCLHRLSGRIVLSPWLKQGKLSA